MSGTGFAARVEQWVFGRRKLLLFIFLLATVVLILFPQISLWLPSLGNL